MLVCKDSFLRSHHTNEVVEKLESLHGEIDRFEYDGEVTPPGEILEELQAVGLLHTHKLVIVDKADQFLVSRGEGGSDDDAGRKTKGGSRSRKVMEAYAASPSEGATLLMRSETWRGGNLDKHMDVFRVGVASEEQAAAWCIKRTAKAHASSLELEAAELLVRRVGMDLGRLDGELAKLAAIAGENEAITVRVVREAVGASRDEEGWAIKASVVLDGPEGSLQTIREIFDLSRDRRDVPAFWAITDLLRGLHAASSLLEQGVSRREAQQVAGVFDRSSERKTADRIMRVAQRIKPSEAADRLQSVLRVQADLRRGIGQPRQALERVTVVLADRIQSLASG